VRRALIVVENESVPHDKRVWQHAQALTNAGVEVSVICPQGENGEEASYAELEGIRIHRYAPRFGGGRVGSYLVEYGGAMREIRALVRRLVRAGRFDVVQACNPPDVLLFAALSARRRGAALVFDHHDLVPELFESRFGRRGLVYAGAQAAERAAFALADVVISTNESYRKVARTRGHKRPEDVFVVRNAPDLSQFRPVAPDEALLADHPYLIGYVGVMGPQDGLDHAIRALAELRSRRDDWRAVFVGEGDVLEQTKELAAALGVDGDVDFLGWLDTERLVQVLATATVCVVPDPKNPLNDVSSMVKVVEYMAMSRPVAAYELEETRITAGDAAAYATPNDPKSLADVIDRLLDDPDLRARMSAAGRARVEAGLSWEFAEGELLAAYERAFAIADRRSRRAG